MPSAQKINAFRTRLSEIIEVGAPEDYVSRGYDILNMLTIVVNLTVSILFTFEEIRIPYGSWLLLIEAITVAFFSLDFILRLMTARVRSPKLSEFKAGLHYIFSFNGLVDVLSFLPYYLPIFFPSGMTAFCMFRVVRIFRLFRINAYYRAQPR
ncbi:MAG: ion transporter [Clostridia bacterium]|nr:ion transporter [Clostridia bacterium]